ncbi:tellurite resistance TerB family protein [Microvirga pudoricolor]|uniref:tellurite resistance TerB family protein n=1 Tax=Microvirga pudoricolor TaxID=2778729 RepID=UPI00195178B0|nr:DUF533 domain-containing protein [Microvirga pudoricolor]MBM6594874.1 tellurite resistance TerB family protein [Microvirga pudoricolor]
MFDPKAMLDALIGAASRPGQDPAGQGGKAPAPTGNPLAGQSSDQLIGKVRDVIAQNPKLSQAAFLGLVGLMFGKRKSGGISSSIAKLGGLAAIGGLAYKAYQGWQSQQGAATPVNATQRPFPVEPDALGVPEQSRFHPVSQTEDDALLYLRAMVAAAASDGQVDAAERARIVKGMTEAGLDPEATRWLESELASPADVEELAANVNTPEKAAQVYAAARIAIDPDTMQEREFLRLLAQSLDLDQAFRSQIEETIGAAR